MVGEGTFVLMTERAEGRETDRKVLAATGRKAIYRQDYVSE